MPNVQNSQPNVQKVKTSKGKNKASLWDIQFSKWNLPTCAFFFLKIRNIIRMLATGFEHYDFEQEKYIEPLTQIFKHDFEIATLALNKRVSARKLSHYHSLMVKRICPEDTEVAFRRKLMIILGLKPRGIYDDGDKRRAMTAYCDCSIN